MQPYWQERNLYRGTTRLVVEECAILTVQDALARQRADGGCDGAGGDAGDVAEQASAVQTVGEFGWTAVSDGSPGGWGL